MNAVRAFSSSFSSWLYPPRCALCATLGDSPICDNCLQEFESIDAVHRTFQGPLELSATVFSYGGRAGQAVRRLKYSRATALGDPLAAMIRDGAARMGLLDYDATVPIPIHWSRRCMRGFNQSELLCELLENVEPHWLRRIRRTKPQARLSRPERLTNIEGAFRASPKVAGRSILLVDDVLTSGQTARECAKELVAAGASRVAVLALAGEPY